MKKFLMAAGAAALAMTAQGASAATFNFSFSAPAGSPEALSGMGMLTTDDVALTDPSAPGISFFAITGLTGTVSYAGNAPTTLNLAEATLPNGDVISSFLQSQNNVVSIASLVTLFAQDTNTNVFGLFDGSSAQIASIANTNPVTVGEGFMINNVTFQISAVPEPATWGLMLVGFGMVGASVRRRRVTFANA